ncbi:MAG: tetratricopeptide repeat protein [Rubrivivax sp.]|nr:tetratricopeptide repeat protein [Rubrivivax sp.]
MASHDLRGNPCATASAAARDAAEQALWRMMSFYDVPIADLDAAIAADPGWALPHVMKAGFLLSLTEPALAPEAAGHLEQARARLEHAGAREKVHLEAVQQVLDGRWHVACRIWDDWLVEHPRDALALQWAQLWDFYRGDAAGLRGRPARALPEWDEGDPLYAHVLALYAFGLEESHLQPQAEEVGRRALSIEPRAPWAVHAVAHVMEMQGRFEEGGAWLRQHQGVWAEGNGFAGHLWWHKALFRLEALDIAGVLRLVDNHLSGEALQITLQRVDAAAMLWRLHLLGEDVAERCAALLAGWDLGGSGSAHGVGQAAGYYAFNDVHAVLAMLGAGEPHRAEAWVARCAERAMSPEDARRTNHLMAREVGLPLMRGLLAWKRGAAAAACEQIYPVRALAQRFGGSHAQRDLIDLTLLAAAAGGGHRAMGRALVNERRMAKPVTPLTRHWLEALGDAQGERA